jgi:hypothetical protein
MRTRKAGRNTTNIVMKNVIFCTIFTNVEASIADEGRSLGEEEYLGTNKIVK